MWTYYEWDTEADFNTWHNNLMATLNYPLDTQPPTTAYTGAKLVEGKWIAPVKNTEAQGLTATELRPPLPEAALAQSSEIVLRG
jgi:hypothetical protein